MKIPSLKPVPVRTFAEQTAEEKMYLLKLEAHQILGGKWDYFRKIKNAGQNSGLFKEKSLFDEMKATQSALKFTSKNTLRQYNLAYLNCLKEIKSFANTDEQFPELPDESDSAAVKEMIPKQDAVIISWTPLKFLLPARQIREKGTASQRHTEGLLAKLFFKVAGYYAVPENWDSRKLSFYLDRINTNSSYQEVAEKLEPLKKDLYTFSEEFEPFKFGQATLSKDITSDSDAFEDAMEVESFESQVGTLYWYGFIYRAIESFLLRYFLTLISSTASSHAVRYLSNIFEPALTVAVDMSILFDGSFDTDASRKRFQKPFLELRKAKDSEALVKKIKTRQGIFEVYNHNLPFLARYGVTSVIGKGIDASSFWRLYGEKQILGINRIDLKQELKHTPYHQLGKSITDTEKQNEVLAGDVVKKTEELADLKTEIEGLKGEIATLEKTHREEKPEEIKEQLAEKRAGVEKDLQEAEKEINDLREKEVGVIKEEQQLAQERDKLLEEEEQCRKKEAEAAANLKVFEMELKTIQAKRNAAMPDGEKGGDKPESRIDDVDKKNLELLTTDLELVKEKTSDAAFKLNSITEKLKAIADKRVNEIGKGFEAVQDTHTEITDEIERLDRDLLDLRKLKKQIEADQIAIEERDVRFSDSRKKLEAALKNAEKNEEKDTKALDDIRTRIEHNKGQILELQQKHQEILEETRQKLEDLNSLEARSLALLHIMALLITCSIKRKEAWQKVLERFKQRLIADQDLSKSRVDEIKKESAKKIRDMHKKASKLKRLKQEAAAEDFEKEIETYQKGVDAKCRRILKNAREASEFQKQRLTDLFHRIAKDKKRSDAIPARRLFDMLQQLEGGEAFKKEFMGFLIRSTAEKYEKNLEPLYSNMFGIFRPTLLNRVSLAQALQKSGGDDGVVLELSDEELQELERIIQGLRNQLLVQRQDIFQIQVVVQVVSASINTLLKVKMDNRSLKLILGLKFTSSDNPKGERMKPDLADKILHLNHIMNPVPENNLLLEGKENEQDPLQQLNLPLFKKLVAQATQSG